MRHHHISHEVLPRSEASLMATTGTPFPTTVPFFLVFLLFMGGIGWGLNQWAYSIWPCRSRTGFLHDYVHVSLDDVADVSGHTIFSSTVKIVQETAWHVANPKIRETLDLGPIRILGRSSAIAALVRACKASILLESNLLHTRNRLCCIKSHFLLCISLSCTILESIGTRSFVSSTLLLCRHLLYIQSFVTYTPSSSIPCKLELLRLPGKKI